ncbi:SigE family RNA polymerase sigma factor [Micromonospora phytophila]|uniref:SigE family RNA polymerase sigma factor n=1 Tax=Micromonospora phytophila TaxID=709888 RepID=UPI00202FBE38|nr:SigE family RNA polymerase sigma factor [Micromonospora phytophila]MCM0674043.1 SigE family RNA polymerase sigma factor [Micromonospora phytophila]
MPEPESFDDFVRACSYRLYRVGCLLTGGDLARAEDLVAETLARLYLAWPRIRDGDGFGYARRTMVNLHTDWWRRLPRRHETLTGEVPDVPDGTDHGNQLARRDSIVRALRGLTRRERAVVALRYFLDLTEQETANELGVSLGTVKSANARALAKLRVSPDLAEPARSASPLPAAASALHREF